ncbi:sensor histidine kinase [Geodermatophilus sp. SYSU D01119]
MRAVLRSVAGRSTWTRAVHLAVGAWAAVACGLVWPGLEDMSAPTLAGLHLAPVPLLAVLACVPAVRRSEGLQARALLVPGHDDVTVEPARTWRDRGRLLLWLVVRVQLGLLAAESAAGAVAVVVGGGRAALPLGVLAAGVLTCVLAGLGALAARAARLLLSPSLTERLAASSARTERLLKRTRLAGELHDSIGHALTVTLLQAGAAREVAGSDPAFVARALGAIEDSARQAATDLERVLALLRDAPPPPDSPTLDDLDGLVRSAGAAGAHLDVRVSGPVPELPPLVSREAYRMAQEGLTNALRHAGPGPVRMDVEVAGGALRLTVSNPVPRSAAAGLRTGAGSGLRGMRERAAVLGGTAEAGPAGDGWRMEVRLPVGGAT